jgi:hypothetical protein
MLGSVDTVPDTLEVPAFVTATRSMCDICENLKNQATYWRFFAISDRYRLRFLTKLLAKYPIFRFANNFSDRYANVDGPSFETIAARLR